MKANSGWLGRIRTLGLVGAFAMSLAACTGGPKTESTGEYIDDTVITTKVKTALTKELGTEGLTDIQVETYKGTVQLSGFVDSYDLRSRAGTVVAGVNGVSSVDNRLAVK